MKISPNTRGSGVWRQDGVVVATRTRAGRGPGWSHAYVKRMARKRRNVLRNRRAHRG
jgi:hypothetical protein